MKKPWSPSRIGGENLRWSLIRRMAGTGNLSIRPALLSHFRQPIWDGELIDKARPRGAEICSISLKYRSCCCFRYDWRAKLLASYDRAFSPFPGATLLSCPLFPPGKVCSRDVAELVTVEPCLEAKLHADAVRGQPPPPPRAWGRTGPK